MTQPTPTPPSPIAPLDPTTQPVAAQLLLDLQGRWIGEGINTLWVPTPANGPLPAPVPTYNPTPDGPSKPLPRFISSRTTETLMIQAPLGSVPNKGAQEEFNEAAAPYADHVYDENANLVHAESGFWLVTPPTQAPSATASVAKLSAIPHGTVAIVQGNLPTRQDGLSRISPPALAPVMPNNPPSGLAIPDGPLDVDYIANVAVYVERRLEADRAGLLWQLDLANVGVVNIPFLDPNAQVRSISATYWVGNLGIRTDAVGVQRASVLAYVQTALITFDGIDWPHVSVGYLLRDMEA